MRYTKRILTFIFAIVLLMGIGAISASAQRRGWHRPVRVYYVHRDPFWGWNAWNNPYYYDPYLREREERYYTEMAVRGNKRELDEHLRKYNADGVLTAKERKELEDDYKDYNRSVQRLNEYRRY